MEMPYESIKPALNLADQVAMAMTDRIRTGTHLAGDKLPSELVLATQFSVSRTVIREAISRLKSLNLVESKQGSGLFVKTKSSIPLKFDDQSVSSVKAVTQMVEVRRALEAEVAALAAERRTKLDIKRIQQSIYALDKAVIRGGDGVEEDINFHRAIADAAKNPFLINTLDFLSQFLKNTTRVTRANEARRLDFVSQVRNEHAAIALAIEKSDANLAKLAATQHMNNALTRIKQAEPEFWNQQGVELAIPLVASSKRI